MTAFHPVVDSDREALVDFMFAHAPFMMFPLTNLARYGLGGDSPRAIFAWVMKHDGLITDALTVSREGMVFPCCPTAPWPAAAAVLKGRQIKGFIGEGGPVAELRRAVGLTHTAELDVTEPAYLLNLADLKMPDNQGCMLKPLAAAPMEQMVAWRRDYEIETLNVPPDLAAHRAEQEIRSFMVVDSHRVLMKNGTPVAMTGFNATLPEIVQVGGVYTPPTLRGRGYARIAVAMHLREVAVDGVTEAVLSAANAQAARVYAALGFERTGDFSLVVYDALQVAHG